MRTLIVISLHEEPHAVIAEQAQLDHQQQLENQIKVQEAFRNWKIQKDLERQLAQASNNSVEPAKS